MKKAIIFSCMLHIILLACFLTSFDQILEQHVDTDRFLPVYIYQKKPVKQQVAEEVRLFRKDSSQAVSQKNRAVIVQRKNEYTRDTVQSKHSELLILLHDLIQTHIQYPNLFLGFQPVQMRVSFSLFPDGHVENVQILQSSGKDTLDKAALRAVQSIQPVIKAQKFLIDQKRFEVQIMFIG
jgi:TonB family protein